MVAYFPPRSSLKTILLKLLMALPNPDSFVYWIGGGLSGLPLKYSEAALEQASSKGHILVLEWWKQAGIPDSESLHHNNSPHREIKASQSEAPQPALRLKPGKSLLAAAQNNQSQVLRWWDNSGIPAAHSESVAKIASQHGHVAVLDTWLEIKGSKMSFDSKVLVEPTKNGHINVLEWWKKLQSR